MTNETIKRTVIAIIILAVIVIVAILVIPKKTTAPTVPAETAPVAEAPQPVTISGTMACLPHRDTGSGVTTMECAFGLHADDGSYYAIDGSQLTAPVSGYSTGVDVVITGTLVPADQIDASLMQKYDIAGEITASSITELKK